MIHSQLFARTQQLMETGVERLFFPYLSFLSEKTDAVNPTQQLRQYYRLMIPETARNPQEKRQKSHGAPSGAIQFFWTTASVFHEHRNTFVAMWGRKMLRVMSAVGLKVSKISGIINCKDSNA
ncbi:hypothetical protein Y032_0015g2850 [Ancylostoma ceylanicum]|uniref:Uncharacterized protein n=1 Tax=Ancylostoma ceylanicum TaxID=53326 RepID=A0A016VAQ8_9BILA|nr:hypothetical protein Y032_0015g2850 [Ancylostoma ceylanicum]